MFTDFSASFGRKESEARAAAAFKDTEGFDAGIDFVNVFFDSFSSAMRAFVGSLGIRFLKT